MKEWLPEEIKEFRKVNILSQKALSELLGVAENYVYFLEKGVRKPSKTLRLLLDCVEKQLKEKGKEVKKHGKRHL
jgi:DNA-binding transcriptional regulator YiaG